MYYRELKNGDIETSLTVGDSYTESGGVYYLTNPSNVTYIDWYSNTSDYSIYKGKYVCNGNNTSCTNIRHIYTGNSLTKNYYYYFDTNNTYSYSRDVSYNGGTYTLTGDIKTFWDLFDSTNQGYLPTHHYTCLENGTSCSSVGYIHYLSGSSIYYAQLSNVTDISTAINNMLNVDGVNQTNSTIKTGIDAWYKKYLLSYDNYIDDTIYCNDRSIRSLGGFNPNGGSVTSYLQFKEYSVGSDLSCANVTDKFSISNSSAQLTYKVGLMSVPEMNLLYNENARKTGEDYRLVTPYYFSANSSDRILTSQGYWNTGSVVSDPYGARPAVSLIPGMRYSSGDGSMANPYVVDTNN
jgi:hypothetical protein